MGMGMLGAMGGLGQAGTDIGKQMFADASRSELAKEQADYLEQKQMALLQRNEQIQVAREERAQGRIDQERNDVAGTLGGVQLPEGATEKDRALASAAALQGKGRLAEGDHFYKRAKDIERSEADNKKYEAGVARDEQRFGIQSAREDRMARAQEQSVRLQGAAAGRAAEDQRFQREDRNSKEQATGMLAGYKIAKSRGLEDAADVYLEQSMGLGVDPRMIDKNDPLSSQVSAAKATLGSMDASKEQKAEALRVLELANKAFNERKTPPGAAVEPGKEPVTVKGQIIGYATTQAEANQMVQAHLKK